MLLFPLMLGAQPAVLFFGDSLTAGYGVDPDQAWPQKLAQRLAEENCPITLVNAGLSGETTAGGLRRLDWVLRRQYDYVVIALGANDGLRGIPPAHTRENLLAMVEKLRQKQPQAQVGIVRMLAPPNMGADYARSYEQAFDAVLPQPGIEALPFLLEQVAGRASLNQADGIHPNPEGHIVVAETLLPAFRAWICEAKPAEE